MTKVLIYIGWNGCKHYAIVAPNGVKDMVVKSGLR